MVSVRPFISAGGGHSLQTAHLNAVVIAVVAFQPVSSRVYQNKLCYSSLPALGIGYGDGPYPPNSCPQQPSFIIHTLPLLMLITPLFH